jgi:uncharacterized protein (DUF934 family)
MQNIIKHGQRVDDAWQLLRLDSEGQLPAVADELNVVIPAAEWLAGIDFWQQRQGQTAVWLSPDFDPVQLQHQLQKLDLIAVDFPSFTDGRGYSIGRLLRERYNYDKELRALGDVWQDQLQALWQVGFDSFEIKQDKSLEACQHALKAFSDHYQSNYRQPLPLFRRGSAAV